MKQFKVSVDLTICAKNDEDAIVLVKKQLNDIQSDWMISGIREECDVVCLYTDGACSGNPGPGGWGAILKLGNYEKEFSGGEEYTTNNRMELMGAIIGLEAVKQPSKVILTSDSKYLVDSVTKEWVYNWENKNWIKNGVPVPNTDLWQRLLIQLRRHEVKFQWVRGHAGHPENERCDKLAVAQCQKFKK